VVDFLFAIDSILAAFAVLAGNNSSKVWMIYVSSLVGMFIIRFAAAKLSGILLRFPRLILSSHILVLWIGLKFLIEALPHYVHSASFLYLVDHYSFIFWTGSAIVILYGLNFTKKPL
jgi:predicted tellurium resistance membrane protein TerC